MSGGTPRAYEERKAALRERYAGIGTEELGDMAENMARLGRVYDALIKGLENARRDAYREAGELTDEYLRRE